MEIIGEWCRRLVYLLRRRHFDDELRREMEAHREQLKEPQTFGNTLRLRDEARDAWGWRWLDDAVHDIRLALRTLRRSPGFTTAAVATLALGIGVNLGMFRVVDAVLLRPLYDRPDAVVEVQSRATAGQEGRWGVSYPNYSHLRDGTSDVFANLAAVATGFAGLDAGQGNRRTLVSAVTADYFQIFAEPLALGRAFTADEDRLGSGARVVIVSHRLWELRGTDPNVLGQTLTINGEPLTIVGVAAQRFTGASLPGPDAWLPFGAGDVFGPRIGPDAHGMAVIGRLRDGVSLESARPALATVSRRLEQAYPEQNTGYSLTLSPPSRLMFMPGTSSRGVFATLALLLMAMPAIVLLVACLNLANLLLARGQSRRQEMAIRSSLGGARWRLTRQMLGEGLLLALAGGAAGLLLSTWATTTLLATVGSLLPVALTLPDLGLDWRVFAATAAFSVLATVMFSAGPAWAVAGGATLTDLKRPAGEARWHRLRNVRIGNVLVIGQVSLSLMLLASGGLFVMSALGAASAEPGFRVDGGIVVTIDPDLAGYDDAQSRALHRATVDRLRRVPRIEAVTIGSGEPFSSAADSRRVAPAGAPEGAPAVDAVFNAVGQDYARALGLPMLGGRDFTEAELLPGASEPVAIVDDQLARQLWPGEDALGRHIEFAGARGAEAARSMRIVGIIPAVKHSLDNPRPYPHVYVPLGQHDESAMTLQLRLAGGADDRTMLATVARAIREVDERLPVLRLETWSDHLDASLIVSIYRTGARVFAAFGAIALLLAIIGVYGVKSYVMSRRTREFGIRIATGAHPRTLLWQLLKEGSRTTAIGVGIGIVLAVAAGQMFQGFLYEVNAAEPLVLLAAPLILLASSLCASLGPALRATRVDPVVALRSE